MTSKALSPAQAMALISRVDPKFRPVWEGRPEREQAALAAYFLRHDSNKEWLAPERPKLICWYCPFACQSRFPSGHRYCLNVYAGCGHGCVYCYAASYVTMEPRTKARFEKSLAADLKDLEAYDVPAAPIHLSNSTDPFQPLEETHGHARHALERILRHRHRFSTVTILTKDPLRAVRLGCIPLFKQLMALRPDHPRHDQFMSESRPAFQVEVSMAFWREEARARYDPGAPPVASRVEGIRALHEAGIPVVLRVDPLFPRSPIREFPRRDLTDFGLVEAQTLDDLENLLLLGREVSVRHVVFSPLKIARPKLSGFCETMKAWRQVYAVMSQPSRPVLRGVSVHLPDAVARERVVEPFLGLCERHGVKPMFCKSNLVNTP